MVTLTERTIMKSRSGVYSDTAENRRKHRVGQKYGTEKQPEDSKKDDKGFEETMEEFSEMFYNGESSEKLRKYLDSRLGEGTYDRISKETSSRSFEESSERKDYFMGRVEDAFLNKNSKPATTDPAKELEAVNKVIAAINEGKLNLPAAEVMKLSEKKQKLEAAKKQAEKINSGVKANEEKKNAEEAKETSKKINEAQKKESEKKEKPADELASAREELQRHKDKKDSWIAKYGKNSYETRLEQIKDNVERLKNKTRSEKEKKADEKNSKKAAEMKEKMKSDKASDPIYQIQQKKKEAAKKYDDKREKARQKFDKESDEIRSQIDKLYESDHPDAAKKRKELWNSLKEKTNKYDEETTKLKNEYEAEYQKLDEAEDKLYDQRHKEETSQESSDTDKEELDEDGELVTITHDKDKFERYRLFRDLYAARMKRGTSPNLSKMGYLKNSGDINKKGNEKYYELQKEFGNKKYAFKEKIQEEKPKEDSKESYTRVKFDDVPNSEKINLKKYLSDKVRKGVDEKWSSIKKIPTENLKKMEKGLVNDLNKNFEAIKKSQRAELLYSIMKVRGELESRGKETQKKE